MKRKINIAEVCKAYNSAREQNSGRKGDSKWVVEILKSFGISGNIAGKMLKESALLQQYHREGAGRGNYKGYIFPCTPVHVSWFQNWLSSPSKKENTSVKKEQSFEEECAEYLRKQGYKLRKCVGFDEEAFKKAYPQLWEKFLIYEEV